MSLTRTWRCILSLVLGVSIWTTAVVEAVNTGNDAALLQTEREGSLLRVGNEFYQLTFDEKRGGALVEIRFEKSGHRMPVEMLDAMASGYRLTPEPAVLSLTTPEPARAVLEVGAAMANPKVPRERWPQVRYRYTFAADSPLVTYEVLLPEQAVNERISRIELLSFRFVESNVLAQTAPRFLLGNEDAFGAPSGVFGQAVLEKAGPRLTTVARKGRLDGRSHAWTGERLRWTGRLFIGPKVMASGPWPEEIHTLGASDRALRESLKATEETLSKVRRNVQVRQGKAASLAAAEMLLAVARDTKGGVTNLTTLNAMLAKARTLAASPSHEAQIALLEDGFVLLCNAQTGLLFRRDGHTAALDAVYHAAQGQNFVRPGQPEASFWRARFRDHRAKQWLELPSARAVDLRCALHRQPDGTAELVMGWPAQDVAGEAVDVRVVVTMAPQDALARWRIDVLPQGNGLGLWEVDFPIFENAEPDRRRAERDFLAYPFHTGYLLEDPSRNPPPDDSPIYPGSAGWQFLAYWQGRAGLYCAAHDGHGHLKRFRVEPNGDGTFRMAITHLPEGMGEGGTRFTMPYECRVGVFSGDWFDATMIYRDWLVQQEWFPKQNLFENDRRPSWFKESSLSYRAFTGSAKQKPQSFVSSYLRLQKDFDNAPATLVWYGWNDSKPHMAGRPDLRPASGFPEIIPRLRQRGIEVMPYTCALLWDVRNPSYQSEGGEAASMRTLEGEVFMARYGGQPLAMVSPAHPAYQDKMVRFLGDACGQMDLRGVYFDMAGTSPGGIYMAAGEPWGGNVRTLGFRELMRRYREEGRKHDPQFVVTMEGNADCYLDCIDSYIAFLSNLPIRMSLYADYQRPYGSKDCEWEPSPVELSHPARQFAWGAPIGRIDSSDLLQDEKPLREKLDYYRKLVRTRNAALPWLAYGRMLRPLTLNDIQPPEPESLRDGQTVPHGVWRAPDGTIAFAFANGRHSVPATKFRFTLDPATYGIPADGSHVLCRLTTAEDSTARGEPITAIEGALQRAITLPGADVLVLLALPKEHAVLNR